MSIREFAAYLGVSDRIVSKWEKRGEDIQPLPANQALLDAALARCSPEVQERFARLCEELANGPIEQRVADEALLQDLGRALKPVDHGAEIARHVAGFQGRVWLWDEYRAWLEGDFVPRVFWIMGPAGVGKTALVAKLAHRDPAVLGVHFCKHGDSDRSDPCRAISTLAFQLAKHVPGYGDQLVSLPELGSVSQKSVRAQFEYLLLQPLHGIADPQHRWVLALDGLDEVRYADRNAFAATLASEADKLPPWLGLVVTSRPEEEVIRRFSCLSPHRLEGADPRNEHDIRQYITVVLEPITTAVDRDRLTAALLSKSEGIFLYVQGAFAELRAGRLSLEYLEEFPQGLTGIYLGYFERQLGDVLAFGRRQRPLLELLCASLEPLHLTFLQELLGWESYELRDALRPLGSLVTVVDGYLQPFHRSLLDWLVEAERSGPYWVNTEYGHRCFADHLRRARPASRGLAEYLERSAPTHFIACGRLTEAVEQLEQRGPAYVYGVVKLLLDRIQSQGTVNEGTPELALITGLVDAGSHRCLAVLSELAALLADFSLFDAAETVTSLCTPSKARFRYLASCADLHASRMTGATSQVVATAHQLVQEADLSDELRRWAHHCLAEGLREQGRHQEALEHYRLAVQHIDPSAARLTWLKASCALADMEYVFGHLEGARKRVEVALRGVNHEAHRFVEASLHRVLGNVELVLDRYPQARRHFEESLKIAVASRRPQSIVEAQNSLAEATRRIDPKMAHGYIAEARAQAEACGARLELGKGYYVEAEVLLDERRFRGAEDVARRALSILIDVGYGSGVARSRTALARALFAQQRFVDALHEAQEALRYYQREQIYPSLRVRVYDLVLEAAERLGKGEAYTGYDEPAAIPNIAAFPNVAELVLRRTRTASRFMDT